MEKLDMRIYLAELESRLEDMLKKWKKFSHVENGEVVTLAWQFENSQIVIDVFWHDGKEGVHVKCSSPRQDRRDHWHGLDVQTTTKVMDRVGNFAQIVMDPKRN